MAIFWVNYRVGLVCRSPEILCLDPSKYNRTHLSGGDKSRSELLETAPTATGIYYHHLQRHWVTLTQQPELAQALDRVMSATKPITLAPMLADRLSSRGSIQFTGDMIPACELYRQAFKS